MQVLRVLPRARSTQRAGRTNSTRSCAAAARPSSSAPRRSCCRAATRPSSASSGTSRRSARSSATYPQLILHSLGASEVVHISRTSDLDHATVITRLKAAGLDSFAGAGAEILVARPRTAIAPLKESGETWLEVMETAHGLGHGVDRDVHDGHRRDERRAHRAPAHDPRRPGPHRRFPLLHPVDLPAGEQPPARGAPRRPASSTCAWSRLRGCSSTTSTTCRARG